MPLAFPGGPATAVGGAAASQLVTQPTEAAGLAPDPAVAQEPSNSTAFTEAQITPTRHHCVLPCPRCFYGSLFTATARYCCVLEQAPRGS